MYRRTVHGTPGEVNADRYRALRAVVEAGWDVATNPELRNTFKDAARGVAIGWVGRDMFRGSYPAKRSYRPYNPSYGYGGPMTMYGYGGKMSPIGYGAYRPVRYQKARPRRATTTNYVVGGAGAGIRSATRTKVKKAPKSAKKKTFADKVKKVIEGEKDTHEKLYMLKNNGGSGGAGGTLPDFSVMTASDLVARMGRSDMYTPTGLRWDMSSADSSTAIYDGGMTIYPFNVANRHTGGTADALPDDELNAISYLGDSFNPKYCAVDYGWIEGANYNTTAYDRVEIVFGIIKNTEKFAAVMADNSWTQEGVINRILSTPGQSDESIDGCNWKVRTLGDERTTEADLHHKDKSQLKNLITVLKRVTYRHESVVEVAADGVDGVSLRTVNALGHLHGEGSYNFPQWALKKQERREVVPGDADPVTSFPRDVLCYKHNVPFIHFRGCAKPDAGDPRLSTTVSNDFNYGLALALRMKLGITDDE